MSKRKNEANHYGGDGVAANDGVAASASASRVVKSEELDLDNRDDWFKIKSLKNSWCFSIGDRPESCLHDLDIIKLVARLPPGETPYRIVFNDCRNLTTLPDWAGGFRGERSIKVKRCPAFVNFTAWSTGLGLHYVAIVDCPKFRQFPSLISECPLVHIRISNCPRFDFEHLGKLVSDLRSAVWLSVKNFDIDPIFPHDFCPRMIDMLRLKNCPNVRSLPEAIHKWNQLKTLQVIGCPQLQSISPQNRRLPLSALTIKDCPMLDLTQALSTHIYYQDLIALEVAGFHSIVTLPFPIPLTSPLQRLRIIDCAQLRHLPGNLCMLSDLKELSIECCPELEFKVREFPPTLFELFLVDLDWLQSIDPYIKHLVNLSILRIKKCRNLIEVPSQLPAGRGSMSLEDCPAVKSLTTITGDGALVVAGCCSISWMAGKTQEQLSRCSSDRYDPIPVSDVLSAEHMTGKSWFSTIPLDVIRSSLQPFFEGASFVQRRTYDDGPWPDEMNID